MSIDQSPPVWNLVAIVQMWACVVRGMIWGDVQREIGSVGDELVQFVGLVFDGFLVVKVVVHYWICRSYWFYCCCLFDDDMVIPTWAVAISSKQSMTLFSPHHYWFPITRPPTLSNPVMVHTFNHASCDCLDDAWDFFRFLPEIFCFFLYDDVWCVFAMLWWLHVYVSSFSDIK